MAPSFPRQLSVQAKRIVRTGLGALAPHLLQRVQRARARRYYQQEPTTGPTSLLLELTTSCNYRCLMCQEHSCLLEHPLSGDSMPWERVERLLREAAEMGTKEVWLAGRGEPLLYPQVTQMISLATSLGMGTYITTNGSRLTPTLADELTRAGLTELSVSLNAGSPETYAVIHGVPPDTRARVLAMLQHFARSAPALRLKASLVLMKMNAPEIVPFTRDVIEAGVRYINFIKMYTSKVFTSQQVEEWEGVRHDLALAGELTHQAGVEMQVLGVPPDPQATPAPNAIKAPAPTHWTVGCFIGYVFSRVEVDGTVHGCCGCTNYLGNVCNTSFRDVWQAPRYRLFRHMGREMPTAKRMPINCLCDNCGHLRDNAIVHAALGFQPLPLCQTKEAAQLICTVTRLALAELIWRYFPDVPSRREETLEYLDLTAAQAGKAWEAVNGLFAADIIQGQALAKGTRKFFPYEFITREMAAEVLRRCVVGVGGASESAETLVASVAPAGESYDALLVHEMEEWIRAVRAKITP